MKISTLVVLSFFTALVGLAPIASAARIDFEKIDKYNADTDHEKKTKTDKSADSKNSEPGALKSEDKKDWLALISQKTSHTYRIPSKVFRSQALSYCSA